MFETKGIHYRLFDKRDPIFGVKCEGTDVLKNADSNAYVERWVDGNLECRWEMVGKLIVKTWEEADA